MRKILFQTFLFLPFLLRCSKHLCVKEKLKIKTCNDGTIEQNQRNTIKICSSCSDTETIYLTLKVSIESFSIFRQERDERNLLLKYCVLYSRVILFMMYHPPPPPTAQHRKKTLFININWTRSDTRICFYLKDPTTWM